VRAAVQEAAKAGVVQIHQALLAMREQWKQNLRPSGLQVALRQRAMQPLQEVRDQEMNLILQQLQQEEQWEAKTAMSLATRAHNVTEFSITNVERSAEAMADNNARMGITHSLREAVQQSYADAQTAEVLKKQAEEFSGAASIAAANSLVVAEQADHAISQTNSSEVEQTLDLSQEIWKDANLAHDTARHSDLIQETVHKLVMEAQWLSNLALANATQAEDQAKKALDEARANAVKLEGLRSRLLAAQQLAARVHRWTGQDQAPAAAPMGAPAPAADDDFVDFSL